MNRIPVAEIGGNLNPFMASMERTFKGPELRDAIVSLKAALSEFRALTQQAHTGLGPFLLRLPALSARLEQAVEQMDEAFGKNGYGSDSTMQRNLERMTGEVADAARSVRLLADFLNRHPEAVLQGREGEQR